MQLLLCARHLAKNLTYSHSVHSPQNRMREVQVFIPILQMGKGRKNKAKEKSSNFKKIFSNKGTDGLQVLGHR